jgi:hypothetical protein
MNDYVYLGFILIFSLLTWGFLTLCEALMKEKR